MESVGSRLKEARTARGMSIEDVAQVTKIPRASLEAIESNTFSALPAPVFARGFVRAYSRTVGLDPNEMLRQMPGAGEPSSSGGGAAPQQGRRPGDLMLLAAHTEGFQKGFRGSQVVLLLLAIGMVLAAWMMVGKKPNQASDQRAQPGPPAIQQPVDGVSSFSDAYVNSGR